MYYSKHFRSFGHTQNASSFPVFVHFHMVHVLEGFADALCVIMAELREGCW